MPIASSIAATHPANLKDNHNDSIRCPFLDSSRRLLCALSVSALSFFSFLHASRKLKPILRQHRTSGGALHKIQKSFLPLLILALFHNNPSSFYQPLHHLLHHPC